MKTIKSIEILWQNKKHDSQLTDSQNRSKPQVEYFMQSFGTIFYDENPQLLMWA